MKALRNTLKLWQGETSTDCGLKEHAAYQRVIDEINKRLANEEIKERIEQADRQAGQTVDKLKTCQNCIDRTVEPNCHENCEGFLKRQQKADELRTRKNRDIESYRYMKERSYTLKRGRMY